MNKSNLIFGIVGVIVGLLLSTMFSSPVGGVYSNVTKDFSEGISVDGTIVIDGSGNIDAPITSTTGTFSSTLSVTGASTLTGVVSAQAEGNKLGSINTYNPIYVGAGDGCTAMLYAASTTLVSSATSTAFCNQ